MNRDYPPQCNPLAPVRPQATLTPRETRAHNQFAREYAEQTRMTRAALLGTAK